MYDADGNGMIDENELVAGLSAAGQHAHECTSVHDSS